MFQMDVIEAIAKELENLNPTNETKLNELYNESIRQLSLIDSNQVFINEIEEKNIKDSVKKLVTNSLKFILDHYSNNNILILKISNLLVAFDTSVVRFSVDAGIINRLGKELVSKHDTAVSELVKNAYDADAKNVKLLFKDVEHIGGTLIIDDDGEGMTKEKLIDGFMRLSSGDKVHNPVSIKYKRRKAGKKGIGRFATQRLGQKLIIITQTTNSTYAYKLAIDWDNFELNNNVEFIENKIEMIEKIKTHGTVLIIEKLRDVWPDVAIEKAYQYVSDLLQPFPLSVEGKSLNLDPGFKVECTKLANDQYITIANEEISYFDNALGEIEGYVDKDGCAYFSIVSKKLNMIEEVQQIQKSDTIQTFEHIKNVHIKAYYYIMEASLLPKGMMKSIQGLLKRKGGIRLYRNGFRVPPYGEPSDDWLQLDRSVTKRVIITPHGNNNFFGFIEVLDDHNNMFEEQSSREGLLKNEAFAELTDFGQKVLIAASLKVAEVRNKKGYASQKDWESKKIKIEYDNSFKQLERFIEKEENKQQNTDELKIHFRKAFEDFKNAKIEFEKQTEEKFKELIDENSMLRILASLGLSIGEFIHEIKFYQAALHGDIDTLIGKVQSEEQKIAIRVKDHLKSLNMYTAYFDRTISQNIQRELENIELRDVVRPFVDIIKNDARLSGIEILNPQFIKSNLYTCLMHKSEWTSILFNLYTNSKKAIRRLNINGKIMIECGKQDDMVYLNFSDNGIGISEEKRERIFNAFYTTSTPIGENNDENIELQGTGLGLKILKDIIEGYDGTIKVIEPSETFKTTIRIELPQGKRK